MKYAVEVTETLTRRVVVEADNADDARDKAQLAYDASEIILDYNDYHGEMDIKCVGEANEADIRWCQNIGEED